MVRWAFLTSAVVWGFSGFNAARLEAAVTPTVSVATRSDQSVDATAVATVTGPAGLCSVVVKTPDRKFWLQPPVASNNKTTIYIGDTLTYIGTKYEVYAVAAANSTQLAQLRAMPQPMTKLPDGWPVSPAAPVYRTKKIAFGSDGKSINAYTWYIRKQANTGPGNNTFVDDSTLVGPVIVTNNTTQMRLSIANTTAGWVSTEVVCNESLGYGIYTWTFTTDIAKFDPRGVLGPFTYDTPNATGAREIDGLELSQWGYPTNANNAQSIVQPYRGEPAPNLNRFKIPATAPQPLKVVQEWRAGSVQTKLLDATGKVINSWKSPAGVVIPAPDRDQVHMNLWICDGNPFRQLANGKPLTVTINSFTYAK